MKTVLVLLQSSAGIAIFRLYCGHPKHQQMLGAEPSSGNLYGVYFDVFVFDGNLYGVYLMANYECMD